MLRFLDSFFQRPPHKVHMLARTAFSVNIDAPYSQPESGLLQALRVLIKKLADKLFAPEAGRGFIARAPNMRE